MKVGGDPISPLGVKARPKHRVQLVMVHFFFSLLHVRTLLKRCQKIIRTTLIERFCERKCHTKQLVVLKI